MFKFLGIDPCLIVPGFLSSLTSPKILLNHVEFHIFGEGYTWLVTSRFFLLTCCKALCQAAIYVQTVHEGCRRRHSRQGSTSVCSRSTPAPPKR